MAAVSCHDNTPKGDTLKQDRSLSDNGFSDISMYWLAPLIFSLQGTQESGLSPSSWGAGRPKESQEHNTPLENALPVITFLQLD